jgi:hypothetical protein
MDWFSTAYLKLDILMHLNITRVRKYVRFREIILDVWKSKQAKAKLVSVCIETGIKELAKTGGKNFSVPRLLKDPGCRNVIA